MYELKVEKFFNDIVCKYYEERLYIFYKNIIICWLCSYKKFTRLQKYLGGF